MTKLCIYNFPIRLLLHKAAVYRPKFCAFGSTILYARFETKSKPMLYVKLCIFKVREQLTDSSNGVSTAFHFLLRVSEVIATRGSVKLYFIRSNSCNNVQNEGTVNLIYRFFYECLRPNECVPARPHPVISDN